MHVNMKVRSQALGYMHPRDCLQAVPWVCCGIEIGKLLGNSLWHLHGAWRTLHACGLAPPACPARAALQAMLMSSGSNHTCAVYMS